MPISLGALARTFPSGDPGRFAAIALAATLLALVLTTLAVRWGRGRVDRLLGRLGRRPRLAVVGIAAGVVVVRVALLPVWGVPEPAISDEFSYLLLGDTFASGRLTNPTHPQWVHFESPFLIHQPVYASVHPVAQGLWLAGGQALAGHPWAGVVASVAVMCGAVCWMLQGWLPPRWAMVGAILAALQFGVSSYWINSFWGGAPAAIGGALALGALPRLERRRRTGDAVLLGLGLAVAANSRPYEGFLLGIAAAGWVLWKRLWQRMWPAALVLAVAAGGMGYYFWRVTGSPFRMPYEVAIGNHAIAPAFVWQPLRAEPAFRHESVREFHQALVPAWLDYRTAGGAWRWTWWKILSIGAFYYGPLMALPLVTFPCLARDRRLWPLVGCGALVLAGSGVVVHFQPHYVAPLTGLLFVLLAQGLRRLWVWQRWGNPVGRYLLPAAVLVLLITQLLTLGYGQAPARFRGPVEARLRDQGGKHLVVVRYGANHNFAGRDWVYNGADLDGAAIVWARDMGARNEELFRYYPDRKAWLLEPGGERVRLTPYPVPSPSF